MKKILLLLPLIVACSKEVYVVERTGLEEKIKPKIQYEFKNERKAKRIQKRLSRKCDKPYREGEMLYLDKCHIEATNVFNRAIIKF